MIKLSAISKNYQTDKVQTRALDNINLHVRAGEFVSIMGPSGCGKSTLLNIIGLLDRPASGQIEINGQLLGKYSDSQVAKLRNQTFGFIFQSFNLIKDFSIYDNIELPLRYRGLNASTRKQRIEQALELVGLHARRDYLPGQLSGGQQQRVAIARAIAGQPRILLADEPTGNLDSLMARQVMELLEQINQQGCTILMVTHDPSLAARAKRQIYIKDGHVSELTNKNSNLHVVGEA